MRLRQGLKYRVTYRIPGVHRVPREMVAVYLNTLHDDALGIRHDEASFSGRPEFGTTSVKIEHIMDAVQVPNATKCYADRKMPSSA
jgi:hypothetical protein